MAMQGRCISFAGVPGSGKTPIANFLSSQLYLPVLNNDAIRTEVIEDTGAFEEREFLRRRGVAVNAIFASGKDFIYDASVDRAWEEQAEFLRKTGYAFLLISLDLSKDFLLKLYESKKYDPSWLDPYIADHEHFLRNYDKDIAIHITDADFLNRLNVSLEAARNFLELP